MTRGVLVLGVIALFFFLMPQFPSLVAQTSPSPLAFPTFEALHAAEVSGANIKNLIDQYNSLLDNQAPDSSYTTISDQAVQQRQAAITNGNTGLAIRIILVPTIALLLALLTLALLTIGRRIRENKLLDMRIGPS